MLAHVYFSLVSCVIGAHQNLIREKVAADSPATRRREGWGDTTAARKGRNIAAAH